MAYETLETLAKLHGVATEYWDFDGNHKRISYATIKAVLSALGIKVNTEEAQQDTIADSLQGEWVRTIAPTVVQEHGNEQNIEVYLPHGKELTVLVQLEHGGLWTLSQIDIWHDPRDIKGTLVGCATFQIPATLPTGYHQICVKIEGETPQWSHILVVPKRLEIPVMQRGRAWGMQAQLYSLRSHNSWGIGDTNDIRELLAITAAQGGDFVIINPVHAAEPCSPLSDSPYLPTSRRFINPLYIRPHDIEEVSYISPSDKAVIDWIASQAQSLNDDVKLINRDACWNYKLQALRVIYKQPRKYARQRNFLQYCQEQGKVLSDFALWSAIYAHYNGELPVECQNRDSEMVHRIAGELVDEIEFYKWLQWVVQEQFTKAQNDALALGMQIGVCADIAVGVHPHGADVWSMPEAFAAQVSVGAPPDMYNQLGQDWSEPPWSPTYLAQTGYQPVREILRNILRSAGAIRMDHILGLFRLWWIPKDCGPAEGTYVYYDHKAMVGVLLLEAQRAGAFVIGEDLGTLEPWVQEYLKEKGILGTSIMWFEKEGEKPKDPINYRQEALVTVNTHDIPPAAGYLRQEHVDLRARLGILATAVEEVRAEAELEIRQFTELMQEKGIVGATPNEEEMIAGLYKLICTSPALILGVSLTDAVGERRAQNQPGTYKEYDNWCIPLADAHEQVVYLDDIPAHERILSITKAVNAAL